MVGDVITRLQNKSMANPESMQPELPPEFAWSVRLDGGGRADGLAHSTVDSFGLVSTPPQPLHPDTRAHRYAESQGVKTFQYGGKRWNRTQARCMFDLAERPMMFFQTEILNLPGPRIHRPAFVDFGFDDGCAALGACMRACMPASCRGGPSSCSRAGAPFPTAGRPPPTPRDTPPHPTLYI